MKQSSPPSAKRVNLNRSVLILLIASLNASGITEAQSVPIRRAPRQAAALLVPACQPTGRYEIRPIETPLVPFPTIANTLVGPLNDQGVALLTVSPSPGESSIVLWNSRTGSVHSSVDIQLPNNEFAYMRTLNNLGSLGGAVGRIDTQYIQRPAVRIGSTISELPTGTLPGFADGRVTRINNSGAVIGSYNSFDSFFSANRTNLVRILPPGAAFAIALDLNESNTVVGYAGFETLPYFRAFTYRPETGAQLLEGLGVDSSMETSAIAVNNHGEILLRVSSASTAAAYHLVRNGQIVASLPTNPLWDMMGTTSAHLNDNGEITGSRRIYYAASPYDKELVVYQNGQINVINENLVSNPDGLFFTHARDLNNQGEMMALAQKPGVVNAIPAILKPECL